MDDVYTKIREILLHRHTSKAVAMGKATIPYLIDALKDEAWNVRAYAAEAFGKIAEMHPNYNWKKAVSALTDALKDENSSVRWRAAEALGKITYASAVPALIDALRDEDADVRWYAARALGYILEKHPEDNWKKAVSALTDALKDNFRLARAGAAFALGKIKDASAVPALTDALKDRDSLVRSDAALALGKIAEKTDIDLRAVVRALRGYFDSVKRKGDAAEIAEAKREARRHYMRIGEAVRKRYMEKHSICGDGIILEGTFTPRSDKKTYRVGREARAFA